MAEPESTQIHSSDLLEEVNRLRSAVASLTQENEDLKIALATTAEHGDVIEAQLYESNQRLQQEIEERSRAQATLQDILKKVTKDKEDLEIILEATAEHGDTVEYQLYTQAVEMMRQSEELFRAISEATPILMILTHQIDGAITYANSTSIDILGLEVGSDKSIKSAFTLKDFFAQPEDEQFILSQLTQNGEVNNYEARLRTHCGELLWVSTSVRRLNIGGRQILLTTLYDISDRKEAELALRKSESILQQQAKQLEQRVEQRSRELQDAEIKYRTIFENAAEGIFQITKDGRFLNVNPALATMYGYDSPEELISSINNIDEQIYVRPRRHSELISYLKAFGRLSDFESEVYRKDGSTIWVSESMRVVHDEAGNLLYYEGSAWDVTERRRVENDLRQQQTLSERLLLNVLPQVIAQRLKQGHTTIADSFSEATVLFADLVNFTEISAQTSPVEVVNLLNTIFSSFDSLLDKYKLEKIKTIGDAYMLVGGVPMPMINHLEAVANASLDMMRVVQRFQLRSNLPLSLRIGIHTGPVVAGIIGKRKFIYDLWGDTVNVASRMESQGESGKVQVTETVYQSLKYLYSFEERGEIEVKGKGTMKTYWLTGQKSIHALN
jgi:PAS domain S-box-containing protein